MAASATRDATPISGATSAAQYIDRVGPVDADAVAAAVSARGLVMRDADKGGSGGSAGDTPLPGVAGVRPARGGGGDSAVKSATIR